MSNARDVSARNIGTQMHKIAKLVLRDPEEEILRLKKELQHCEELRDEWCKEYTRMRDELEYVRSKLRKILGRA